MFGSTLAAVFNAPKYQCALKSTHGGNPEFAVTPAAVWPQTYREGPGLPQG